MSRTFAHSHTRSLNSSSNWRRIGIIARGRLRIAGPFLAVGFQSSVPCLPFFVYRMDKVELKDGRPTDINLCAIVNACSPNIAPPTNGVCFRLMFRR